MTKIPYDEIIYIESLSDYIQVNTLKEQVVSKEKISIIATRLPDIFLRIHRSFIVNTDRIKEVSFDELLVEGITLNIGRSYRNQVKEALRSQA